MHDFILQIILMGALGTMVYLVARAVPRVSDGEAHLHPHGKFDAWLSSLPLEKIDAVINATVLKSLRKTRVGVLKVDNLLSAYLNKVKSASNGKGEDRNGGLPADQASGDKNQTL